jgi:two-component system chemotaxis sensor kinase CheA
MDMSKYREMFLSETQEHLRSMSRLVVTLEQRPSDREGIDSLFRAAHSIKGMAASMGYEQTAQLAHHLEDLLDGFRKEGAVPAAAVDRLLAGIDLLEGLLEDIAAEKPERAVSAFLPVADASADAKAAPAAAGTTPAAAALPATPPRPVAGRTLQVRVELTADAAAPAARALLLLREMERLGTLLESTPSTAELQQGGTFRRLEAWLATEQPPGQIQEALAAMADVARVSLTGSRPPEPPRPPQRDEGGRGGGVGPQRHDSVNNQTGEDKNKPNKFEKAVEVVSRREAREERNKKRGRINHQQQKLRQVGKNPQEWL